VVELRPIGTRFEVAEIGTKALLEPAFVMLRNVLLGLTTLSELQCTTSKQTNKHPTSFLFLSRRRGRGEKEEKARDMEKEESSREDPRANGGLV